MAKVRIVYGSETGNTESIAEAIRDHIKSKGHDVDCASAADVDAKGLGDGYDCVLMGTSVWGTDTIELQSDFEAYADAFADMGLTGKKCAAFASGDTAFELYCGGVDFIEEQYANVKATVIAEGLRIEGSDSGNESDINEWADKIVAAL